MKSWCEVNEKPRVDARHLKKEMKSSMTCEINFVLPQTNFEDKVVCPCIQ